ncbi:hypothetical protein GOA99_31385 [Sinorhizobium meliloti]|uniref:hypothetical protein n=1 Tax=Rhizobium meliloti TaxID=382 RepID=UPI00299ECB0B|nr:hypothetical protein [Sinorhizobium meliloti]MDW9389063.1 hypothetical protein [Sinorhizobium meliloti]MDW9394864.1 hypothetical protein [Sinorhizobium meliloti]MDW9546546.1 hypothetical protein [Sinorhizobium meliloti]MDW9603133.1 hypothetical protein [Sinorhizobium meliloti]
MPLTLSEAMRSRFSIKIYGLEISDADNLMTALGTDAGRGPKLAMVYSFAMGAFCKKLPVPTPMVVFGPGEAAPKDDDCANKLPDEKIWTLLPDEKLTAVTIDEGTAAELLDEISTRGIDGGLTIENPRFENGQLCATIHAWAKIEIFGRKIGFDERIPVCIPLQGCYPIWSIEIAKIEACFRAPSELCIQLCVGKWGISKCWDACVHIPLPATASASEHKCSCGH